MKKKNRKYKTESLGREGKHGVQEGFWKLGEEDGPWVQQGEAGRAQWGQTFLQDCRQDGFQQGSREKNFLAPQDALGGLAFECILVLAPYVMVFLDT